MSWLPVIGEVVKPITDLIDELHTSKEEKAQLQLAVNQLTVQLAEKMIGFETTLATKRAEIIVAEATGHSWLQRNWRPVAALTIVAVIPLNYTLPLFTQALYALLGWGASPLAVRDLPAGMWALATTLLGGYVASRGVEKVTGMLTTAGYKLRKD